MQIDAERSALGAALLSAEAHARVRAGLSAEDFTTAEHQAIFAAMCRLYDDGKKLDSITLADALGPQLGEIGGMPYITELFINTVTAANVERHIEILRESSIRRRFLADLKGIYKAVQAGAEDYLEQTGAAIDRAHSKAASAVEMVGAYAYDAYAEICEGRKRGLPTGFVVLDQTLGGLNKGHVCIVAGRPSMGKTSFAANIAANVAQQGGSVAFFTLEQPRIDIAKRMLISLSECTERDVQANHHRKTMRLAESLEVVGKWKLSIIDDAYTIDKMRESCYALKRQTKALDLVVIDYLGLIKTRQRKGGTREQEIAELSRAFKLLAREMDCPILLLSQLSRESERRTSHRPMLSDLRDSGAIEQDADEVLFLYRPAIYDSRADGKEAVIIVAKNRNGQTGEIDAQWDGEHFTYRDAVFEEMDATQEVQEVWNGQY